MSSEKAVEIIKAGIKAGYCGPACVAWACYEQRGFYPNQPQIAWESDMNEEWGMNKEDMLVAVGLLGLTGEWGQKSLDELMKEKQAGASVIVNWMSGPKDNEDGHYSVLYDATRDNIIIQDPEWVGSLKIMDRRLFEKQWWDIAEDGSKQESWSLVIKKRKDE